VTILKGQAIHRWLAMLAVVIATAFALVSEAAAAPRPSVGVHNLRKNQGLAVDTERKTVAQVAAPSTTPSPQPEAPASPAPAPTPKPGKDDVNRQPIYVPFLKDPKLLGFSPDERLFDDIYHKIKTQHIDREPDEKLFAGVVKEVTRLLTEAKVPMTVDINKWPKNTTLPKKIAEAYGKKVNTDLLWFAMVRGVLEGTDDPYSVLMTPREYHTLMEQMQSESFGGIGIYIELDKEKEDQLTVVEPLDGTPAYKAGLLPGDQVWFINGTPTKGITLDMATAKIRGPVGSDVKLTIKRPGQEGLLDFNITRAMIEVASVSRKMLEGGIGYVRLRLFGAKTGQELSEALDYLHAQGARALIIDLRNNGGGYINAAIDVCSNFVKPGDLVTYVTDRRELRKDYTAVPRPAEKLPMVLLVNNFSASASEITAGCLKDYSRATLMGVKTFGKGSVQQLYPLPSGAALKLTIAHFFTPKGAKINKVGVEPDQKVQMEAKNVGRGEKDTQLQSAIQYLRQTGRL